MARVVNHHLTILNHMGFYTELVLNLDLIGPPQQNVEVLNGIVTGILDKNSIISTNIRAHPFFQTGRWHFMLRCSAEWHGCTFVKFEKKAYEVDTYQFSVRSVFKNYSNEIGLFLDWISPYIYSSSHSDIFLGYKRTEDDDYPVLIFITKDKQIRYVDTNQLNPCDQNK